MVLGLRNIYDFVFIVLPDHGQYCTYRYVGSSLHDVHSMTKQLHIIFLEIVCVFGRGCCYLLFMLSNVLKIINIPDGLLYIVNDY